MSRERSYLGANTKERDVRGLNVLVHHEQNVRCDGVASRGTKTEQLGSDSHPASDFEQRDLGQEQNVSQARFPRW